MCYTVDHINVEEKYSFKIIIFLNNAVINIISGSTGRYNINFLFIGNLLFFLNMCSVLSFLFISRLQFAIEQKKRPSIDIIIIKNKRINVYSSDDLKLIFYKLMRKLKRNSLLTSM